MTALVRLNGLSKRFTTGVEAVRGIDLALKQGAITALLGPSGSGKSTLLRMIAGLSAPSTGTLTWATERPRLGVVFQEPTLMPWARVEDNVGLPLELDGVARHAARSAAQAMLARVGLKDFTKAYPSELSGGMKMRVSLARALVGNPHLLLLDEPFAALDEIMRAQLNRDLLALWALEHPAVLFITHSIYEAVFLAERIHVLSPRPGRIVAEIPVSLPYPRDDGIRLTPAFLDIARDVSSALAQAMETA